jgi:hypothetical protein
MQRKLMTVAAIGCSVAAATGLIAGRAAPARATSSHAGGHMYWLEFNGPGSELVGRATVNGAHANPNFMRIGKASAIALDNAHLYWLSNHGVGRANLDGSSRKPGFLRSASFGDITPGGLAVDSSHIYFTDPAAGPNNTIARANTNGSGLNPRFINLPNWAHNGGPTFLALTNHYIYWLTADGIGRANLDGTGITDPYIHISGLLFALGFAFDGTHFYWTVGGSIGRVNVDGSGLNKHFITGLHFPGHVQAFNRHIYWGEGYLGGVVRRANMNGTHIATVVRKSGTVNGIAFAAR